MTTSELHSFQMQILKGLQRDPKTVEPLGMPADGEPDFLEKFFYREHI